MELQEKDMTISELSRLSGLPLSTIKFYIREELIPGPRKTRGTRAYYSAKHLHRLELIKKIQSEGSMPLAKIREIMNMIEKGEKGAEGGRAAEKSALIRREIIQSAIPVFRKKGYEKATIADIVDAAGIGRSTFYSAFKNKKELFVECIKEIIFLEMEKGEWDDTDVVKDEKDILEVFDRHAMAYYNVNPMWIDMVNLLRAAAINDPEEFTEKLDEVIHLKISMLKRAIETGIKRGLFRRINATLMAVMLLGLQDYNDYIMKENQDEALRKQYEEAKEIILYGILKK